MTVTKFSIILPLLGLIHAAVADFSGPDLSIESSPSCASNSVEFRYNQVPLSEQRSTPSQTQTYQVTLLRSPMQVAMHMLLSLQKPSPSIYFYAVQSLLECLLKHEICERVCARAAADRAGVLTPEQVDSYFWICVSRCPSCVRSSGAEEEEEEGNGEGNGP